MSRKKKAEIKRKPDRRENKSHQKRNSSGDSLKFAFFWTLRITLVGVIVGALFWKWNDIRVWLDDITEGTVGLFGWGLVLVVLAALVIAAIIWRHQLMELARRWKLYLWNKWLAAVVFVLSVWGILALLDKGGSFGQTIIGEQMDGIGALRVVGFFLLGVVLLAPRATWGVFKGFFVWIGSIFKAPPRKLSQSPEELKYQHKSYNLPRTKTADRAATTARMIPPEVLIPPEMSPDEQTPISNIEAKQLSLPDKNNISQPRTQEEMKQVAQSVWKKYGETEEMTGEGWHLPPIDILDQIHEVEFSEADNVERARLIEDALASYGVEVKVGQINAGPTVTQFGIEPGWDRKYKDISEKDENGKIIKTRKEISKTRVKVEKITSLANDLALALAAPSIRIEAPVPGKSIVGIEVPNTDFGIVSMRGVIETNSFQKIMGRSTLALALGKGAGGEAISGDLARMPHLLIAGATGSGKTVCLNAIICCLLLNNTPEDTRFIMIDPKRVELTLYNSLPHLATPVIVDTNKALGALRWLGREMDNRYKKLALAGARNLEAYNKKQEGVEKMPYMVLVIDELADLMMTGYDEVEHILCRLAQLSRAVGIHLVVATQRPSVDVITGLIKANFPTRISFAVTSQVDSRTILDGGGAEKLLGRGDMLYMPTEAGKPKRLQGCFVSDAEMERLVYFWNSQKPTDAEVMLEDKDLEEGSEKGADGYPQDPLMVSARRLAEEHTNISTSFLQRKLHIGYPRAARIMESLREEMDNIPSEDEEDLKDGGAEV